MQGGDGNFYGTTYEGGTNNVGTVYQINTNGVFTSLYSFIPEFINGAYPFAGLVQGSDRNFFGTTVNGGTSGAGTVFKVSADGSLKTLYSFTGGNDGANPYAGLVQGSDGYFYGTTYYGGPYTNEYGQGFGTAFKISTNGALTTLCSFTGDDGEYPLFSLVQCGDGNFYGTTESGGTARDGNVFRISINGMLTSLYSFVGGINGQNPGAGLVHQTFLNRVPPSGSAVKKARRTLVHSGNKSGCSICHFILCATIKS